MDVKDYINEAHRQLNNKFVFIVIFFYKKLNKVPTTTNAKLVNYPTQSFKKEKSLKEKNCRRLESVKPQNSKILYATKN